MSWTPEHWARIWATRFRLYADHPQCRSQFRKSIVANEPALRNGMTDDLFSLIKRTSLSDEANDFRQLIPHLEQFFRATDDRHRGASGQNDYLDAHLVLDLFTGFKAVHERLLATFGRIDTTARECTLRERLVQAIKESQSVFRDALKIFRTHPSCFVCERLPDSSQKTFLRSCLNYFAGLNRVWPSLELLLEQVTKHGTSSSVSAMVTEELQGRQAWMETLWGEVVAAFRLAEKVVATQRMKTCDNH